MLGIEQFLQENIINYGVIGMWLVYMVYKENVVHKKFFAKIEELVNEIKRIK